MEMDLRVSLDGQEWQFLISLLSLHKDWPLEEEVNRRLEHDGFNGVHLENVSCGNKKGQLPSINWGLDGMTSNKINWRKWIYGTW